MISLVEWAILGGSAWRRDAFHSISNHQKRGMSMDLISRLWREQEGQDIAEYAVMLAVILVIVVGTVRLIGSNANTVFSSVASSLQ
jgi:Flp pilus assembly pilin Flp